MSYIDFESCTGVFSKIFHLLLGLKILHSNHRGLDNERYYQLTGYTKKIG